MIPSLSWSNFAFPEQYRKPERKKSRPAFEALDAQTAVGKDAGPRAVRLAGPP
ncbi:hypothetical protein L905_17450 [Agrobacterium sp. TS43]|nr:hypothetical protein L906_14515 [Agrobacterium sp. TS45]KVK57400.1 hypothetical protein L907_14480 [Agrobacterium sp. C13]KVK66612.1 hypothetical protein L905_17450 [Agrobacterium sp. TS43]